MKLISLVLPVWNEEETLPELHKALRRVLAGLPWQFEIIFVDDGSSDRSLVVLEEMRRTDGRIRILGLARNFGHQQALAAGLDEARGAAVILMDADMQDDPGALPMMLQKWEEGFEVVYAVRVARKENLLKRAAFYGFYRLQKLLVPMPIPLDAGIFGLMDRKVVDVVRRMPERNRYLVGLRAYAGFRQTGIEVERGARHSGSSRVGLRRLIRLALDGIFAFSTVPLRLVLLFGLASAAGALGVAAAGLVWKYGLGRPMLDWPFGLSTAFFFGGVQLVSIGIIGEYVGRIYEEVKQRPYYVVARKVGFDEA
jgi:dolichol-phosphate mannosyltransferase